MVKKDIYCLLFVFIFALVLISFAYGATARELFYLRHASGKYLSVEDKAIVDGERFRLSDKNSANPTQLFFYEGNQLKFSNNSNFVLGYSTGDGFIKCFKNSDNSNDRRALPGYLNDTTTVRNQWKFKDDMLVLVDTPEYGIGLYEGHNFKLDRISKANSSIFIEYLSPKSPPSSPSSSSSTATKPTAAPPAVSSFQNEPPAFAFDTDKPYIISVVGEDGITKYVKYEATDRGRGVMVFTKDEASKFNFTQIVDDIFTVSVNKLLLSRCYRCPNPQNNRESSVTINNYNPLQPYSQWRVPGAMILKNTKKQDPCDESCTTVHPVGTVTPLNSTIGPSPPLAFTVVDRPGEGVTIVNGILAFSNANIAKRNVILIPAP